MLMMMTKSLLKMTRAVPKFKFIGRLVSWWVGGVRGGALGDSLQHTLRLHLLQYIALVLGECVFNVHLGEV